MTTSPQDRPADLGARPPQATEEIVRDDGRTRVVRVIPTGAGDVLLRTEPLDAGAATDLRRERHVLSRLVGVDGVPQLVDDRGGLDRLVLLDPGADRIIEALPMGGLDNAELVRFALALTRIVAAVHQRGVLHLNISPGNILVTEVGRLPILTGFEVSRFQSDEELSTGRTTEIVGAFAYLAPEQTGRTGHPIDQRSDLYALGATLYELATGRPPFGTGDPLRLVHSHLALVPDAPVDVEPRVSRGFSDVVMRLLEKEPESRYQSAEGLAFDLALLRDRPEGESDAPLRLGTRDFPVRVAPPVALVGRDREVDTLVSEFAFALRGRGRGVLIAGADGVGKSALVEQLRPAVTRNGGWMVSGRYDEYRKDVRSDAGWQALRALGRLLLAESEEDVAFARARLREALGRNAGLIGTAIPEFGVLLDIAPDIPTSADLVLAERRGLKATLDLVRAIVSTGRPLVLVLDDLQWAGPTALGIIDGLLTDDGMRGLFVVGTYRDTDLDPDSPLRTMITRWRSLRPAPRLIRLGNLSTEELRVFLQEMLRLSDTDAAELSRVVGARTHGNPYDTGELVNALRRDGLLVQHEEGWSWDPEMLRHYGSHIETGELLASRLDTVPRSSAHVLEVMACLGSTVEVLLLADASGESVSKVEELIAAPIADGFVVVENLPERSVRFRHDRIRDAVSGRLSASRRTQIQREVARRLAPVDDFASAAARQYLAALDTVEDEDEKRTVVDLFRRAATDVRSIHPSTAERYLAEAVGLVRATPGWDDQRLLLGLRTEQHAVLNLLGRHHDMDQLFSEIQRENPEPTQIVDLTRVQISSLSNRGEEVRGFELGLDLLRRLGIDAPRMPVSAPDDQQWQELSWWADNLDPETELRRPPVRDEHALAVAAVLEGLTGAAFYADKVSVAWLVFEAQRQWVRHGPSSALAAALGLAPAVIASVRKDYRTGYTVVRHVLAVAEARGYTATTSFLRGCLALFASYLFEPLENTLAEGRQARDELLQAGDSQNACYMSGATLAALMDTAPSIDALDDETEQALDLARTTGNNHAASGLIGYRQLLRALRGQTDGPGSFTDDTFDESAHLSGAGTHPVDASVYRINRALSAAVFGDLPTLVAQARATMPIIAGLGGYREVLANVFQALALSQQLHSDPAPVRADMLAELDRCRDWLAQRAHDAPVNFRHLLLLVDAERAWSLGDREAAITAFDAALMESDTRSRPWHRALIAERAAQHHFDKGWEHHGRTLIAAAYQQYDAWGATAKVAQLERAYPFLRATAIGGLRHGPRGGSGRRVTSDTLDLLGLIRASQALSSERNIDSLRTRVVDVLSEVAGATSVQFLMWDPARAEWVMPVGAGDGNPVTVGEAAAAGQLPLSAFRYAERTREPLLVDDATRDHRFAGDPYFNGLDRCSVLVEPVMTHSEPRAMLMLENNLSRGAFSTDRLDAVNLIVGQLSVSLDNALVYSSLERRVSERTRELEVANGRLEMLAVTDVLTGLANRRRLIDVLELELLRSLRSRGTTGVVMIDIDYFKQYNDHYGHLAGDRCLRKVAAALQHSVRGTDVVARYGGEEFAVVLPDTDLAETTKLAERARSAVAALREPHVGSELGQVTVSVGAAAQVATRQTTVEQVLAAADAQLYEAKTTGRNRVQALPS